MFQIPSVLLQEGAGFGVGIVFVLLFFLIVLGGLALWLGLAYWTYRDAQKRDLDSPGLWALVVFAAGVFGLVAYVLVREDR